MGKIDTAFAELGALDVLAGRDTPIHRLDPRAKVVTTAAFILTVVSFGKYEVSALLPFFAFPMAMAMVGGVPLRLLLRKLLLASPFILLVGIANPWLDREVLLQVGRLHISGGWTSFASVLLRFTLTVSAAILLVATTGFNTVCMALGRLGVPRVFVLQLLFLYRYIFVLLDEVRRAARARSLRSFAERGMEIKVFASMVGQLLVRTLHRAQRIDRAMRCRGFDGNIRVMRPLHFGRPEIAFTFGCIAAFLLLRLYPLPHYAGELLLEIVR